MQRVRKSELQDIHVKHPDHTSEESPAAEQRPQADAARARLQLVASPAPLAPATPHTTASRVALGIGEAISIFLAAVVSDAAYHAIILGTPGQPLVFTAVGLLTAALFASGMNAVEANQRLRDPQSTAALRDVTFVWLAVILAVTFFAFSVKAADVLSRGAMLSFMALGYIGLIAVRTTLPAVLARNFSAARLNGDQQIVVGAENDESTNALLRELVLAGYPSPQFVAVRADCSPQEWPNELRRALDKVMAKAHAADRGEICIAGSVFSERRLADILAGLQIIPRAVRIVPSPVIEQLLRYPVRGIGTLNAIELQRAPMNTAQLTMKRAIDIGASILILTAILPLLGLIAVAIRIDSRGPILFRQRRLGLRGQAFDIFKFRTMTVTENGDVINQAQKNDARVTRVGYWLRRLSLDEFPQLLNVIRGEMSLVGPRPHALAHDRYYGTLIENYEVRQHVKPGMTGWAQVNGLRGETKALEQMRRRVEFDVWYAKNASVALDIKIILLTFIEVLRQRNAH
jgi:undecaprenyl-phosphate galactose phosphotransferase/putative colanic acid biosynthesis UDP-glucose lipid carrier transferase